MRHGIRRHKVFVIRLSHSDELGGPFGDIPVNGVVPVEVFFVFRGVVGGGVEHSQPRGFVRMDVVHFRNPALVGDALVEPVCVWRVGIGADFALHLFGDFPENFSNFRLFRTACDF